MAQRIAGLISFSAGGIRYSAKGAAEYNLGRPKKSAVMGTDGFHGYKEEPQVAYIEIAISDRSDLDLDALVTLKDAVVTLELANGKVIALRDAFYAADGKVSTEEGEIEARFEGSRGEEVL